MSTSRSLPVSTIVIEGGFIDADIPCRQCGYNLRGLVVGGRCPECGLPLAVSVHGRLLQFSRPQWLDRLRYGVNVTIGGLAIAIVGVVLARLSMMVMQLAVLAAAGFWLVGVWLLTTPDPSGLGEDEYGTSRKIIRFSLAISVVGSGIEHALNFFGSAPAAGKLVQMLAFAVSIVNLVGFAATTLYLSKLVMRIPDLAMHRRARFLTYAIGISYGLSIVGAQIILFGGGTTKPTITMGVVGAVAGIATLALLIFCIMYLILLERMGKAFKLHAAIAREHWARLDSFSAGATPAR